MFARPFSHRRILHSTREQKLKSIYDMVNIPSSIQTDEEKLSKGRWRVCVGVAPKNDKKMEQNKWHLSRMINFISTHSVSSLSCALLIYFICSSYCEREFRDCRLQTCYVQSPAYPGLYPRALKCRYRLHTRQPFIKLFLQNEQFGVDGQRYVRMLRNILSINLIYFLHSRSLLFILHSTLH